MARTPEQILKEMYSEQIFSIAHLLSRLEVAQEKIEQLSKKESPPE